MSLREEKSSAPRANAGSRGNQKSTLQHSTSDPSNNIAVVTHIEFRVGKNDRIIIARGRVAWALAALIGAGGLGVSTAELMAPRWSHYVSVLRRRYGLNIKTEREAHGGPFPGTQARYRLVESAIFVIRINGFAPKSKSEAGNA